MERYYPKYSLGKGETRLLSQWIWSPLAVCIWDLMKNDCPACFSLSLSLPILHMLNMHNIIERHDGVHSITLHIYPRISYSFLCVYSSVSSVKRDEKWLWWGTDRKMGFGADDDDVAWITQWSGFLQIRKLCSNSQATQTAVSHKLTFFSLPSHRIEDMFSCIFWWYYSEI